MTHYLIALYDGPDVPQLNLEDLKDVIRDVDAVAEEAKAAGVWVFGGGMGGHDTAKTVRVVDGRPMVSDGPFAETKEYLGGFSVVDVPDLDTALVWAKKLAVACRSPQEVKPFIEPPTVEMVEAWQAQQKTEQKD